MVKKILLVLLVILVLIQFFHPAKNASSAEQKNYIGKAFNIPADVKSILEKACMDCHSNNPRYPWYAKVQPVDWWLTHHVNNGKKELNLDEYTNRSLRYQYHKMEEVAEQVKNGNMPLNSYTWMHKGAILSEQEKTTLINWAESIQNEMKAKYPPDSLLRKSPPAGK